MESSSNRKDQIPYKYLIFERHKIKILIAGLVFLCIGFIVSLALTIHFGPLMGKSYAGTTKCCKVINVTSVGGVVPNDMDQRTINAFGRYSLRNNTDGSEIADDGLIYDQIDGKHLIQLLKKENIGWGVFYPGSRNLFAVFKSIRCSLECPNNCNEWQYSKKGIDDFTTNSNIKVQCDSTKPSEESYAAEGVSSIFFLLVSFICIIVVVLIWRQDIISYFHELANEKTNIGGGSQAKTVPPTRHFEETELEPKPEPCQVTIRQCNENGQNEDDNMINIVTDPEPTTVQQMDDFVIDKFPLKGNDMIYKAKKKGSSTPCALKRIPIPPDETEKQETLKNVQAICSLDHEHLVKCTTHTCREGPQEYLYMHIPFNVDRTLDSYIKQQNKNNKIRSHRNQMLQFFKDLCKLVKFLHNKGFIINEDLNCSNILLDENLKWKLCCSLINRNDPNFDFKVSKAGSVQWSHLPDNYTGNTYRNKQCCQNWDIYRLGFVFFLIIYETSDVERTQIDKLTQIRDMSCDWSFISKDFKDYKREKKLIRSMLTPRAEDQMPLEDIIIEAEEISMDIMRQNSNTIKKVEGLGEMFQDES